LDALLAYARARGAKRVWGDVLNENYNMLTLAREMGATTAVRLEARGLTRTEFNLETD
jgi:hypothetical protein